MLNTQKQTGFSLIEVLLALIMGLLLSVSFLQLMVGASRSTHFHEDLAAAQANGRHSLYLLSREIRMAGYKTDFNSGVLLPFYRGGCNGVTICTRDGGSNNNDQLAVQFEPVSGMDCGGNTVPSGELTADVYYIAQDSTNSNVSSLFCRGYNPTNASARGPAVPLVQGVEKLQVVYGLSASGGKSINQYVTASNVTNWRDVRSVRLGILVSSGQTGRVFDSRTRTFNLLGSGAVSFTDRTPRYVYTTAIKLNNTGF